MMETMNKTILELTDYNKLSTEAREYLIRSNDKEFVDRLNNALKQSCEKFTKEKYESV